MNRPEEANHRAIAAYLRAAAPSSFYWTSVAHQRGTRKRFEMGILKALGVRSGCPDIVACHNGRFIGIEIKAPKGRLSENQEATSDAITLAGGLYAVVRSVDEVDAFLRMIGVPMRGRIAA